MNAQPLISPRTAKTKVKETAIDLGLLALAIPFGFELARAKGYTVPDGLESKATAFLMALGGVLARYGRHWWVYLRRKW